MGGCLVFTDGLRNFENMVSGGDRGLLEDGLKQRLRVGSRFRCSTRDDDAMSEDKRNKPLYIIGQREVTTLHKRKCLHAAEQRDGAPGTDTEFNILMLSRGVHDVQHVVDDLPVSY